MSRVSRWVAGLTLVVLLTVVVASAYTPTNLDTKKPPKELEYISIRPDVDEVIYENDTYIYSFKDDRDVLTIFDKRNGYTWKSGLDIASSKAVKAALRKDEPLGFEPLEVKMNETFTAIANSLVTVEYYDDSNNIKRLASASDEASSTLMKVAGEDNHFVLDVAYEEQDITLKVHLIFTEGGYQIDILGQEFGGADLGNLAAVMLNPFLGASGGMYQLYDKETGKHGDQINKPEIPGYVLVPDGSGALIRFNDYMVSLKTYEANVYGKNLAKDTYNNSVVIDSFKPFKEPLLPVYGIAHGDNQAAFVGYATEGDENMQIIVTPEENTTLYTFAYPRFEYNKLFYQIFNKRGDGYFTLEDDPELYDVSFRYDFLAGGSEDSHSADYVGMALTYRDYLIEKGILSELDSTSAQVPMRLDFMMSDLKKSVLGYENVVTTTAEDVGQILDQYTEMNINAGLIGWQEGGATSSKLWKADFDRSVGSKGDFKDLFEDHSDVDISFVTDYVNIHEDQVRSLGNAAKHINNWYLNRYVWGDVPFDEFNFARPIRSVEWLNKQLEDLKKLNITSHTIYGMSNILLSEEDDDKMNTAEVADMYRNALDEIGQDMKLNLNQPNQYLWSQTDRFLQAPVYPTQFLIETDTVPFLQLVLNNTMEVYGPYSNFSFSGTKDMLRMIDYNIYPSFVLTKEASYLLSTTNSLDMYSTEFEQYDALIREVYETVNEALSAVTGANWTGRQVVENGVILNTYDNGVSIIINYTETVVNVEGAQVEPLSALVIR